MSCIKPAIKRAPSLVNEQTVPQVRFFKYARYQGLASNVNTTLRLLIEQYQSCLTQIAP
jgi:hypothetical protein